MVVQAIRHDNPRARVNERHDIVLDQGPLLPEHEMSPENDTHRTAYEPSVPLKVSGSAYKLTRQRALHHGTCLINSSRVGSISGLLRSRAAPFIKARGVDSVRSPVGNVYPMLDVDATASFQENVVDAFCEMYGIDLSNIRRMKETKDDTVLESFADGVYGILGQEVVDMEEIRSGITELKVRTISAFVQSFTPFPYSYFLLSN